jgi:hypothetical protein
MKRIINYSFDFFLLISLIFYYISCSDAPPTKTSQEINYFSYQIPGCNHSASLQKDTVIDSCFQYSFIDTLKVEFCVPGNCCPDSNRFITDYNLSSDTIYVTVVDTAAHMCHCICNYVIHLELAGLSYDRYIFYCEYEDLVYNELIIRSNRLYP